MNSYNKQINGLQDISFSKIKNVAWNSICQLPKSVRDENWKALQHGIAILDNHEVLCQYLCSYGNMHRAKLKDAFAQLPKHIFESGFEIVDWGCGQAMGSVNLFDYMKEIDAELDVIKKITLIEPSEKALDRAIVHANAYVKDTDIINSYRSYFEDLKPDQIKSHSGNPVLHIFSNILDVAQIDLKHLAKLIDDSVISDNYIISVGPLNATNKRIDAFHNYFNAPIIYNFEEGQFDYGTNFPCTYKAKIYKLTYSDKGNLIPVEFYPSVQFLASYQLDCMNEQYSFIDTGEQKALKHIYQKTRAFEVSAPFDIGASVYDDIHPILAVLNNIITRGLPTKASPYIEEVFKNTFEFSSYEKVYGTFFYKKVKEIDLEEIIYWIDKNLNEKHTVDYSEVDLDQLQLIFSPIAIARVQKTILEAIMTGKLEMNNENWKILVEEKDVPCAALALKDLSEMFNHLTQLSDDFNHLTFPEVELTIIGNENFSDSKLHLDKAISNEIDQLDLIYDLVIDVAVLQFTDIDKESFSKFKCKNKCYFNIRSSANIYKERNIYTTDKITYRSIVDTDTQGYFSEIKESTQLLTYFLKLLFRKESFRPGQLPILSRALSNKSVIGLLPTGGGKSLTYQLAAMLQPGVTIIVDPLKSLMQDQYDGLLKAGIDSCALINSELTSKEKEAVALRMEQSKLHFIFLSPERLAIYKFREKLKNMHNLNVYFSYGVIDEVHCVSEWGHDFRFSYLHLGRNLYKYVRAKEGHISLFGLTATASFDVLADVERELSGSGAFPLDAETIIRYENSNRLELQYKIEKINIEFEDDKSFDRSRQLESNLPRAVKTPDKWGFFNSKNKFLSEYITKIPGYINELQSEAAIKNIKNSFEERQELDELLHDDLLVDVPHDIFKVQDSYEHAGIIFCPHKGSTGISVEKTKESLIGSIPDLGTFMGGNDVGNISMKNLELFRDNEKPLMVATKAFGMGIDKPNVRFTVNMNYSSSLESFVQEAGRAGRDRKIALSVILLSNYDLVRINRKYGHDEFPLNIIKNFWFKKEDLFVILDHYNLNIDKDYIDHYNPRRDIVKLRCEKRNKNGGNIFNQGRCEIDCKDLRCNIRNAPNITKVWGFEKDFNETLATNGILVKSKNIEYQNADYETVMYFYNSGFKGSDIEKLFLYNLLRLQDIGVFFGDDREIKNTDTVKGFLNSLLESDEGQEIVSFVEYINPDIQNKIQGTDTDIAKAIYRMTCIELIEDFTQDYANNRYRIVAKKKKNGAYYEGLKKFLLRYYSKDRTEEEIKNVYEIKVKSNNELEQEIFQCLNYLTAFVYDKISVKRKRAIDDMRTFCITGIDDSKDWKETNEELKDFIYYYFNSKYAKTDYKTDNGAPYSLVNDTDGGKISNEAILFKYLKVVEDEIVGVGTPIDNAKHLQGAVRLISRSLTDSNPALALLEAFTLIYLGTNNNANLEKQLVERYSDGMLEMSKRSNSMNEFWGFFEKYNDIVLVYLEHSKSESMVAEIELLLHSHQLKSITSKYLQTYE